MLVTVRPRVLVPESYHVTQLVHHDAELVAVLADGDGLRPVASLAHKGTTTENGKKIGKITGDKKQYVKEKVH